MKALNVHFLVIQFEFVMKRVDFISFSFIHLHVLTYCLQRKGERAKRTTHHIIEPLHLFTFFEFLFIDSSEFSFLLFDFIKQFLLMSLSAKERPKGL